MIRREPYIGMPIYLGEEEQSQGEVLPEKEHKARHLAMAYVPIQEWGDIYDSAEGFNKGTIFRQLNLPFLGYEGGRRK